MFSIAKIVSPVIMIAAMIGALSTPLMVWDAMAVGTNQIECGSNVCTYPSQRCDTSTLTCVPAPEMSDYLAMTLVMSSLGAIFYIRRRSLATA